MTLETAARVYSAVWWIPPPRPPRTDPRARRLIQDARINDLTTPDNKQDK